MENTQIIKCPLKKGNTLINWLRSKDMLNSNYKIHTDETSIFIPIIIRSEKIKEDPQEKEKATLPSLSEKLQQLDAILIEPPDIDNNENLYFNKHLIERFQKGKSLEDALKKVLPHEIHHNLPSSFDIIGNIAILELEREEFNHLHPYNKLIGETMVDFFPNINSVFLKKGKIDGIKRVRKLELLAGEDNTTTIYKENQCRLWVDVENVYFTPRLSFERERISNLKINDFNKGITWDVFCGVGPFLIQIAKKNPKSAQNLKKLVGTDINHRAIDLADENKRLNHLMEKIDFFCVDVKEIWKKSSLNFLRNSVSRLIMNLPKLNLEFFKYVVPSIHPQGTLLHIYQFNDVENPEKEAVNKLNITCENNNVVLESIVSSKIVKSYSPSKEMTVLDAIIKKSIKNE